MNVEVARRKLRRLAAGATVVACGACGGSTRTAAPVASDSTSVPTSPQPAVSTTTATIVGTSPGLSQNMSVVGSLRVGAEFDVLFSGSLRASRGGYLWLQSVDGTNVALLRGNGNSEIPMGYDLDVTNASMLDDGLSGDVATFVLPPDLDPGTYRLCTANSLGDDCIEVDVAV